MNKLAKSKDGYIVFDDSGTSPIAYGAAEKWFPTYDEAIRYALDIVNRRIEEYKEVYDCNSVIVYEGVEQIIHETHSCPCGNVIFSWRNYKG